MTRLPIGGGFGGKEHSDENTGPQANAQTGGEVRKTTFIHNHLSSYRTARASGQQRKCAGACPASGPMALTQSRPLSRLRITELAMVPTASGST